jgi:hypothetical protein
LIATPFILLVSIRLKETQQENKSHAHHYQGKVWASDIRSSAAAQHQISSTNPGTRTRTTVEGVCSVVNSTALFVISLKLCL